MQVKPEKLIEQLMRKITDLTLNVAALEAALSELTSEEQQDNNQSIDPQGS